MLFSQTLDCGVSNFAKLSQAWYWQFFGVRPEAALWPPTKVKQSVGGGGGLCFLAVSTWLPQLKPRPRLAISS